MAPVHASLFCHSGVVEGGCGRHEGGPIFVHREFMTIQKTIIINSPHPFRIKNAAGDVTNREVTHGSFSIAGGTGGHYRRDRRHRAVERPEKTTSLNSLLPGYAKEGKFFLRYRPG
jgi:hypothetical protein